MHGILGFICGNAGLSFLTLGLFTFRFRRPWAASFCFPFDHARKKYFRNSNSYQNRRSRKIFERGLWGDLFYRVTFVESVAKCLRKYFSMLVQSFYSFFVLPRWIKILCCRRRGIFLKNEAKPCAYICTAHDNLFVMTYKSAWRLLTL